MCYIYFMFIFFFTENMYRKGARRWRKLYWMNGHLFQTKRFSKVTVKTYKSSYTQVSYKFGLWLYGTVVTLIFIGINFIGLAENKTFVDFLFLRFATIKYSWYIYHSLCSEFHGLMVPTKTTEIGILRKKLMHSICSRCLSLINSVIWFLLVVMCTWCNFRWYSFSLIWYRSVVFSRYSGFIHQ